MQTFLRLLQIVNRLITETETAFHRIFPSLKNGELLALPMPADPTEFLNETYNMNSAGIASATSTLKPRVMTKRLLFFGTFMSVLFLTMTFSTKSFGQDPVAQATVTSDADDYAPRSTATFTGAGFEPGEEVILKVKNLSYPCNTVFADSSYLPWTVTADGNGAFVTTWLVCECPGDSLRLKATGQTSGSIAYAYFLDNQLGNNAVNVAAPTLANGTGVYGAASVFDYLVSVTSSNGGSADLSQVTLSASALPAGASGQFLVSNILVFGSSTSTQTATFRITTQDNTQVPTSPTFTITATPKAGTARSANGTLTITRKTVTPTVKVDDKVYDGLKTATISAIGGRTLSGVLSFGTPLTADDVSLAGGTATFPSEDVGVPAAAQTITVTGLSLTGSKANNYVLSSTSATASASITPKTLLAIFTIDNKVYDGTTDAIISARQLSGAAAGEGGSNNKLNFTGGVASFVNKDVGSGKTVNVTGTLTLGGSDATGANANNYVIGTPLQVGNAAITFRTATIVYTVSDRDYNGTTSATIISAVIPSASVDALHGLIAGDNVTVDFSTATVAFNSKDVATTQPQAVTASGFKLTGPDGPAPGGNGNYQVNVITSFISSATMNKKPITVSFTANSKVYDGTTTATIATRPLTGVVAADLTPNAKVTGAGGTATFSDFNWGTGKTVTAGGFTLTGSAKDNYVIVYVNAPTNTVTTTANITRRPIDINVTTGQTKVYGQDDPNSYGYNATAFSAAPAQGLATTDAFSGALTRAPGENVANYNILQSGLIIIRSGTSPLLNVSDNYTISYTGATFGITPLDLTITPDAGQNKVYGQSDPSSFAYEYSPDLVNGDVAVSVFSGNLGRTVGETVLGGPYAYTLGNLSAGTNYNLILSTATPLSTFDITPKAASVTPNNNSKTYGSDDPTPLTTGTLSGFLVADNVTALYTRVLGENVLDGPYTISATLSPAGVLSNYEITYNTALFSIGTKLLTVTADPKSVQYSDIVTFSATISGFAFGQTLSTSGVTGSPSFTTSATLSSINAVLSGPGNYSITPAIGTLASGNYSFNASSFINGQLTVTQENARAYYTGSLFASTSGTTATSATVTLSATIKDITAVDYASDPNPGDIRNAKVTFVNRDNFNAVIGTAPLTVGLVDASDTKVGTATVNWTADIGSEDSKTFTVGIIVSGYYTRNCSEDNTTVTVSKPIPGMITGGGYVLLKKSSGKKAGTVDTKNNFGFNVKLSKNNAPQGNINTIIRRLESDNIMHVYQIKGNAMTQLSITGATNSSPGTAVFNGKANIQDITNPVAVAVDGNATLQVTMTDLGEPGANDRIAITLWDKAGGLWFTNNWDGTRSQEQQLGGGNLKVSSTSATGIGTAQPKVLLISSVNPSSVGQSVTFSANVSASTMPTGKVVFYDYSTNKTLTGTAPITLSASGIASFTTNSLTAGSHTIVAYYCGDSKYSSGSASLTQVVNVVISSPSAVDPSTIEQVYDKFAVKILQNPSPTYFTVQVSSSNSAPVEILVYDVNGRKVGQYRGAVGESIRIGHSLTQGAYFIQVLQGKNKSVTKVVKK